MPAAWVDPLFSIVCGVVLGCALTYITGPARVAKWALVVGFAGIGALVLIYIWAWSASPG